MSYPGFAILRDRKKILLSAVICMVAICATQAAAQSDKKEVLSRASQRYYNLRQAGLVEFQASLKPNWEVVLAGTKPNSEDLKLLNGLRFSIAIDAESKFTMDHRSDTKPAGQRSIDG